MTNESSEHHRAAWRWLAFAMFVAGPAWFPAWEAIDNALRSVHRSGCIVHHGPRLFESGAMATLLALQGLALSVAAAWIAWRRRIVVLRSLAIVGLVVPLYWVLNTLGLSLLSAL